MIWIWPGGPGARHRQTDCELATPCIKNAHAHSRLVNVGIMRWAGRSGRPGAGHHHGALHNGRLQDAGRRTQDAWNSSICGAHSMALWCVLRLHRVLYVSEWGKRERLHARFVMSSARPWTAISTAPEPEAKRPRSGKVLMLTRSEGAFWGAALLDCPLLTSANSATNAFPWWR